MVDECAWWRDVVVRVVFCERMQSRRERNRKCCVAREDMESWISCEAESASCEMWISLWLRLALDVAVKSSTSVLLEMMLM